MWDLQRNRHITTWHQGPFEPGVFPEGPLHRLFSLLHSCLWHLTLSFSLTSVLRIVILDPSNNPRDIQALRSTLDGKHWILDESKPGRASSRPPPPADPGRAPSKPHGLLPPPSSVPSRVLFPSRSQESFSTSPYTRDTPSPSHPLSDAGGDDTIIVRPPSALDERPSFVDHPSFGEQSSFVEQRSFVDDFLPPGLTSSHLLSGSGAVTSAVSSVTGAVLNTTAAAVRTLFASEPPPETRSHPNPLLSTSSTPPFASSEGTPRPPLGSPSNMASGSAGLGQAPQPPTLEQMQRQHEQFREMQRQHEELRRQFDALVAQQSTEQHAKAIDSDIENRRKTAYEEAGIPYTPAITLPTSGGNRITEYRISHKSIGYLRPADALLKPFEAVEGAVYVRPLAWLAHLKTKLELRDDFHFKNQVLQVASECLLGRAAAWWTTIGQRMRNYLLADYTLELWHTHIQVLCQSREQTRKTALARQWKVHSEECWDYVWDKAALFEELDPRDRPTGVALISEILDGLPTELARMCRKEFSDDPTFLDLTKELQVLVPRWKRDLDSHRRPPAPTSTRSRSRLPDRHRANDSILPDVSPDKTVLSPRASVPVYIV